MAVTAAPMFGLFIIAALMTLTTFPLVAARTPYVFVFDVFRDRRSNRFTVARRSGVLCCWLDRSGEPWLRCNLLCCDFTVLYFRRSIGSDNHGFI